MRRQHAIKNMTQITVYREQRGWTLCSCLYWGCTWRSVKQISCGQFYQLGINYEDRVRGHYKVTSQIIAWPFLTTHDSQSIVILRYCLPGIIISLFLWATESKKFQQRKSCVNALHEEMVEENHLSKLKDEIYSNGCYLCNHVNGCCVLVPWQFYINDCSWIFIFIYNSNTFTFYCYYLVYTSLIVATYYAA